MKSAWNDNSPVLSLWSIRAHEFCGSVTDATREQASLLSLVVDLRRQVALELEQRIITCEMKKPEEDDACSQKH